LRLKLVMEKSPSGPSVPDCGAITGEHRQADRAGGQKCVLDRLEAGIARLPEHLELGGAFAQGRGGCPPALVGARGVTSASPASSVSVTSLTLPISVSEDSSDPAGPW
jgi:hypothetical protein